MKDVKNNIFFLSAIIGAAVISFIIIFSFFPDLHVFLQNKKFDQNIDSVLKKFEYYNVNKPSNTQLIKTEKFSFYIPQNCEIIAEIESMVSYGDKDSDYRVHIYNDPENIEDGIYVSLAALKELSPTNKYYSYANKKVKGFLMEGDLILFKFYDKDHYNSVYQLVFSSTKDKSLIYSTINSIHFNA